VTSLFKDEKPVFERVGFGSKAREFHRALATDTELDGVDLRVFLYLAARLNFEKCIPVPQLEIAEALGRRKEHISRSMAKLKAKAWSSLARRSAAPPSGGLIPNMVSDEARNHGGQGASAAAVVALFKCCVRFLILLSVLRQPVGPDRLGGKCCTN